MALDAEQAREMVDATTAAGLTTMVPFTYRWMPTNQWIKALVDDGYVGRPYHLNLRYFTGYARSDNYSWRFDAERSGGGLLGDLGSHWLHVARWWLGEITQLGAVTATFFERGPRPDGGSYTQGEDSALVTARFASGAIGSLQVSAVCWEGTPFGQTHHAEIHGSDGTLYAINDWDTVQEVRGVRSGETGGPRLLPVPEELWQGARRSPVHDTYRDVFRQGDTMARAWVSAVAAGRLCQPDLAEGARVQQLLDAAARQCRRGWRPRRRLAMTPARGASAHMGRRRGAAARPRCSGAGTDRSGCSPTRRRPRSGSRPGGAACCPTRRWASRWTAISW